MKKASEKGFWMEFGNKAHLMVVAVLNYRHDNPEGSLVRGVLGCSAAQVIISGSPCHIP